MPIEDTQEQESNEKIRTQVVVKQSNMKRLRESAKKDNRSTSGQLNWILESWFDHIADGVEGRQFENIPF